MNNQLAPIIVQKQREVAELQALIHNQPQHQIAQILQRKISQASVKSLRKALRGSALAIIAEIKRKSPSKGSLAIIKDPVVLAQNYVEGGANALSVLTDEHFFGGKLADLTQVAASLREQPNPVLRKDFVINEIQIAEAIAAGADAILCIVAVLGEQTKTLLDSARSMGIEALVEVHNEAELDIALASGAEIIGVNNRDLSTFQINTQTAFMLLEKIPQHIVRVAESGILVPELAKEYYRAGFDAVLIGEALVKSASPAEFIRGCRDE